MSTGFGSWECRECKVWFYGGGAPIHETHCSHYDKWPEPGDGGVFGRYAGCDYLTPEQTRAREDVAGFIRLGERPRRKSKRVKR